MINLFHEQGFVTGSEIARKLIEEQLQRGGSLLPWIHPTDFQQEVFSRRLAFWKSIPVGQLAFSDRAIPDQLAFMRYRKANPLDVIAEGCRSYRYFPTVFVTPPWKAIYRRDAVRGESWKQACELHELLLHEYREAGYQIYILPLVSVDERCRLVLQCLEKQLKS